MALRSEVAATAGASARAYDVERVRADFPLLRQQIDGQPLAYLDNAATTQKPQAVLDALLRFYTEDCANIHRSVHRLGERATRQYEAVRARARRFLNAAEDAEIVFVRGTTEAINLVAQSFARTELKRGDEVLITALEHHSNIVPWQLACEAAGARLRVVPIDDEGQVTVADFEALLSPRTRIAAVAHISNALGTVLPVAGLVRAAHARGVPILIDGAQAAPHTPIDVRALDCDFYALSGHKMYGPTGIGLLYGKSEWLRRLPPWQGGGDMIASVAFEGTTYNEIPYKFEAGTPNIAATYGLGAAMDYLDAIGRDRIAAYEGALLEYAQAQLAAVPGLRLVGTATPKAAVLSFDLPGIHPHDVGTVLDAHGVAVRAGHHCAQPVMERMGVAATTRASLGLYNTHDEIDRLVAGLQRVREMFA